MKTHTFAVVGDLHFEEDERETLENDREVMKSHQPDTVVSLGDLGGYSHCGTERSFHEGLEYFSGFEVPFHPLIGNHDMECLDYATDEDAVALWCRVLRQDAPYHAFEMGPALGVCLSQTSFRRNEACHHEIRIEEEQRAWFERTVEEHADRPIFVFSHAPILGSGIRVLQNLHLKGPNAYLNHHERPEWFIDLVQRSPQIKLWFSGHNHLGQDYPDSITQQNQCVFVHTGVMARITRDHKRQGRLVRHDASGVELFTVDYDTHELRLDAKFKYGSGVLERLSSPEIPEETSHHAAPPFDSSAPAIGDSSFQLHKDALVEYTRAYEAPIGVVEPELKGGGFVLRRNRIIVTYGNGEEKVFERRPNGRFYGIHIPNPLLKEKQVA